MREHLRQQLMPAAELARLIARAGCPVTAQAIGLAREDLRRAYDRVHLLRNRYTVMDLAFETGAMPRLVDSLFAPSGHWAPR